MRFLLAGILVLVTICFAGCVRRTINITSDPPGALVWLNDREVGRTPVQVDFLFYGTYDVRLEREGYEPQMTSGHAQPPWWDSVPLDLLAEAWPGELHSDVHWHYQLQRLDNDPDGLLRRAHELRSDAVRVEEASSSEQTP